MTTKERLYTVEDWLNRPDEGKRYELIHGEFIEMPSSSRKNTVLAAWIIHLLIGYVVPKGLGFVSSPDGGYRITDHDIFQPDVGFISNERAGGLDGVEFSVAPDLAVEIISPSESGTAINEKTVGYFSGGAQQVWNIYPRTKSVYVYTAANKVTILTGEDTLDDGDVLPGFAVKLSELFKVLD